MRVSFDMLVVAVVCNHLALIFCGSVVKCFVWAECLQILTAGVLCIDFVLFMMVTRRVDDDYVFGGCMYFFFGSSMPFVQCGSYCGGRCCGGA